jgi:hypothetical protein
VAGGGFQYPIGVVDEPGKAVRRYWVVGTTAVGVDASNYYIFSPFIVEPDGTLVYLGKARGTWNSAMTPLVAFCLHEEESLSYTAIKGSVLGVQVDVVGSPTNPGRLLFQASVIYVG